MNVIKPADMPFDEYLHFVQEVGNFPIKKYATTVFNYKPKPTEDTFKKSAFFKPEVKHVDALVLYAPTLDLFYTIDNSESAAETTYSESITTGFTFGMSQEVTVGAEFEFDAIFAKGKVSFSITLGFSQEWTKSYTETISIMVPGGEKAFMYRGVMKAAILRYDAEDLEFRYLSDSTGAYESGIIKTTKESLV